jgi:hypothetical protein
VRHWILTISLITALLADGFGSVPCILGDTTSSAAINAAATSSDSDVPECCRNGLCPHHAALRAAEQSRDKTESCTCSMSSNGSNSLIVSSTVLAMFCGGTLEIVELTPAGPAIALFVPDLIQPFQLPSTPPPKA